MSAIQLPGVIKGFQGEHRWLSNFWPARIILDNLDAEFPSVEHAYVAGKYGFTPEAILMLASNALTPAQAKRLGRKVPLPEGWETNKLAYMVDFVRLKFGPDNPELRQRLLDTGDAYLEETNHWGDTFWGVCRGEGQNHLGRIIMETRDRLRKRT